MKTAILALFIVCAPFACALGCDGNGNCYIYAGATGSGNGTNWTNAYTGFGTGAGKVNPASMTRGVTYWIANGAYGQQTFSSASSGTTVITIEGATTSSHGPAGDWSNAFAGQATFIGDSFISTNYWTFNGQSRGGDWQSSYTLKFWNQSNETGAALDISGTTGVTLKYVEIEGTGNTGGNFPNNTTADHCSVSNPPCGVWQDNGIYQGTPFSNFYIGYSWVHHTGNTQFQMNAAPGGVVNNGATWEYNWVSYNHTGQNGQHDEAYSLYSSNVVIRYNVFQDIAGSGQITTAGGGAPQMQNWDLYGNLFFWDPTYAAFNAQYDLAINDNGILDFLGEAMSGFVHFTNNTVVGLYNANMDAPDTGAGTVAVTGDNFSVCGSGGCPTVVVVNNLFVGNGYTGEGNYCTEIGATNCTMDYNAAWQGGIPSGSQWQMGPTTHDYNVSGSTNPFVNLSASTIAGYELNSPPDPFLSHTGTTLGSPYNIDMLGVTRAANGTFDRGALQISGAASSAPSVSSGASILGAVFQ